MTAHARLLNLRRALVTTLAVRAVLASVASAMVLLLVARTLALPGWSVAVAALASVAVLAALLLPLRVVRSLPRVALWVEERTPALRYSLVTVAEGARSPQLDAQALGVPWWTDAQRALLRSLVIPGVAFAVVTMIALWSPSFILTGARSRGGTRESQAAARARVTDVLASVHVAVVPPAYAARSATSVDDPTSIEALIGSSITVSGPGDANLVAASVDSSSRGVAPRSDGWSLSLTMPARPAIVRLESKAGRHRLIVLAPVVDAPPAVTLLLPLRDTIVRKASGPLVLRAQLRDDIGLHDAAFELVVSSGSGENFTFRSTTVGRATLAGRAETTLDARVSLDSLDLKPGDVLQLRAVARDGNDVSGPGIGSSETRSLRVARGDEYDSVSVDAAPPPEAEAQMLSQRMLINLTEALDHKKAKLTRPMLIEESRRIAMDQKKLRKRVGDIVFQRLGNDPLSEEGSEEVASGGKLTPEEVLKRADAATGGNATGVMDVEGDETPILSINKPLLEAFNAMWDAGRALEVGEPAKALPPMRIALAAIERARQAERIYLRGKPSTEIVDIAKVRLAGKDKGTASVREARVVVAPEMRRRSATFERVTALLARDPDAAADSLLVMRVDALGDAPALASALDEAARALRKRDNAAIPLAWIRVRRALGGAPVQRAGVSAWLGAP
jgi:hypothetical protein